MACGFDLRCLDFISDYMFLSLHSCLMISQLLIKKKQKKISSFL